MKLTLNVKLESSQNYYTFRTLLDIISVLNTITMHTHDIYITHDQVQLIVHCTNTMYITSRAAREISHVWNLGTAACAQTHDHKCVRATLQISFNNVVIHFVLSAQSGLFTSCDVPMSCVYIICGFIYVSGPPSPAPFPLAPISATSLSAANIDNIRGEQTVILDIVKF